jgi:hypothetical protein
VLTSGFEDGAHVVVGQLVTQDREHHQHGIELSSKVNAPDVPVLKEQLAIAVAVLLLFSRPKQHVLRPLHPNDVVATSGQRKGVVARSASEVEHTPDRAVAMRVENFLDDIALRVVVLVAIERVVAFGIIRPEDLAQESTSCTASLTRDSCSSVNAKPEGK